jgi:4-hydroxythreonine-4-phosphate dehydrogenase
MTAKRGAPAAGAPARSLMRPASRPTLALTTGEPAGIGPEIATRVAKMRALKPEARLVLIGDMMLLAERCVGDIELIHFDPAIAPTAREVEVLHVPLKRKAKPGKPDARNAAYVLATLDAAIAGCAAGTFHGMVTAPVQKSSIADAGIAFTGHTEYLAEKSGMPHVVMMLADGEPKPGGAKPLRVALATTHLPLAAVPKALTAASLGDTLRVLHHDLRTRFGLRKPHIVVAGLNPHAGEGGHLGLEEQKVIAPVMAELTREGLSLEGPLPADTLFQPHILRRADAVLAMYHDQGLPVLKYATFGHGVNVTLGLPFVRTSVDHGTALDLAASGARADAGSLVAAVRLAAQLSARHAA